MDDLEVMLDEGDFEVVDECMGEEEPTSSPMESEKPTNNSEESQSAAEPIVKSESNQVHAATVNEPAMMPIQKNIPPGPPEPDFTADISLDNIETISDEPAAATTPQGTTDVIVLQEKPGNGKVDGNADSAETDSVVEIAPPQPAWYEEKLKAKSNIVNERLSKLARVLELSYPVYKPWLEHTKMAVYRLDPPRRCPLDKPHTNRWKFGCSRKTVEESTNEEEGSAQGTVDKKLKTVWRLSPTGGSGVNTDNASQYPPFVMRVVKVFEEFIQSLDEENDSGEAQSNETKDDSQSPDKEKTQASSEAENSVEKMDVDLSVSQIKSEVETTPDVSIEESGNSNDRGHKWLSLLVRSNSKDELMIFAAGTKISEETMQKLKQTFETGAGKDCNVKSLYCKSITSKSEDANITFLSGTEALDETVGGLKIQLAPKTNFWCNTSGVEQLGAAVKDLLAPLVKTTVIEVGCGLGLMGLMIAPECKKLVGLDAPCEVEEAEMTSELNKVKNASFIMGQPGELMSKVTTLLKNSRAAAIVNGNTKLGRDINVMAALRKIPSLRRIVMITTLTKQSVRAILELTRPSDTDIGHPFMPLRAVLVDTLPTGPYFEVVIRMERLNVQKINEPWFWNHIKFRTDNIPKEEQQKRRAEWAKDNKAANQEKKPAVQNAPGGAKPSNATQNPPNPNRRANNRANRRNKMKKQKYAAQAFVHGAVTGVVRRMATKSQLVKNPLVTLVKNPMAVIGKAQLPQKGKTIIIGNPNIAKKPAGNQNIAKKPAGNQTNVVPAPGVQPMKDSPASPDPVNPVKVPKTTKTMNSSSIKRNPMAKNPPNQGSKFVPGQKRKNRWAPIETPRPMGAPGGSQGTQEKKIRGNRGDLRGRLADQQVPNFMTIFQNQQHLLKITEKTLAEKGMNVDAAKELQNMLNMVIDHTNILQNQLPRSVWDRIAPPNNVQQEEQNMPRNRPISRDRFVQNMGPQDIVITTPNREFDSKPPPPPPPPLLNQHNYIDRNKIMPAGMSSHETRANQQRPRGISACLQGGQFGKSRQQNPPDVPLMSSTLRPPSPKRPLIAPSRMASPPRWEPTPLFSQQENRRQLQPSPPPARRQPSPPRRLMSPTQNNPYSDIFQRRPTGTQSRPSSEINRREMSPARQYSPPRYQSNWEPNRDSQNWNQRQMQQDRSVERNVEQRWSNDRPQNSQNWNNSAMNDRYRENPNQGNRNVNDQNEMWIGRSGGDTWNPKQSSRPSGSDRQWTGSNSGQGPSGDNWNSRGNGNYGQSDNRGDNWRNPAPVEKDWSDLPDDAKDPWGDDVPKNPPRWQQQEKQGNSNWSRPDDQGWSNKPSTNNWQNKPSTNMNTNNAFWQNNQNNDGQRWQSQNNSKNSASSVGLWPTSNFGNSNWKQQNYPGSSSQQRQNAFGSSQFKDRR